MPKLRFRTYLKRKLKDPKEADAYLEAALQEKDPDSFLSALRDVTEAQGGMSRLARRVRLNRAGLYRMFSKNGNPSFRNILNVLASLGYHIHIRYRSTQRPRRAKIRPKAA